MSKDDNIKASKSLHQLELTDGVQLTGSSTLQRLREAISPPGKKSLWLKDLSDKQLAEVWLRLKQGQALDHIVRVISDRWKVRQDLKKRSMSVGLKTFRERVLSETDLRKDKTTRSLSKDELLERKYVSHEKIRLREKFNPFEELIRDIEDFKEHVVLLKQIEREKGIPMADYHKDFKALVEAHKLYFDAAFRVGLLDSKPSEHNVKMKIGFEQLIGRLPDNGARMIDQANMFIKLVSANCVELECGPDGVFEPSEDIHATEPQALPTGEECPGDN